MYQESSSKNAVSETTLATKCHLFTELRDTLAYRPTVQASHGKENTGSAQLPLFLTIYIRRLNKINGVQSVGKINSTVRVNCLCPCLAIPAEAINRLTKRISRSISYEALIQGDDKDLITRQREMQLVDKAVHLRCALRIIFQMPLKFAT